MNILKVKYWIKIYKPIIEPMVQVHKKLLDKTIDDEELNGCIIRLEHVAESLTSISKEVNDIEVDVFGETNLITPLLPDYKRKGDTYDAVINYYNYISERGGKIIKLLCDRNLFEVSQSQEPS